MRSRLTPAAVLLLAGALAGCGGTESSQSPTKGIAAPAVIPVANAAGPTQAQLDFRERLLEEISAGTYTCSCTSALRAKDRIASGKVKPPPADRLLSNQPPP